MKNTVANHGQSRTGKVTVANHRGRMVARACIKDTVQPSYTMSAIRPEKVVQ